MLLSLLSFTTLHYVSVKSKFSIVCHLAVNQSLYDTFMAVFTMSFSATNHHRAAILILSEAILDLLTAILDFLDLRDDLKGMNSRSFGSIGSLLVEISRSFWDLRHECNHWKDLWIYCRQR